MILTQTVDGVVVRTLITRPYIYDTENQNAVVFTQEEGAVAISAADTPELWEQFMAQKEQ